MGLRYLGNIIKPGYNPLASNITTGVNTAQFQGVFTLQQQTQAQNTQRWATDPLFENTTLLLQADNAANGAQNNTFIDSSSNNFTITRNGNTTQGTFTPFSQSPGWWGNYFSGSGTGFLNAVSNTVFAFGTGDFTLEAFINVAAYPSAFPGTTAGNIISAHNWNGSGFDFTFRIQPTGLLYFENSAGNTLSSSTAVPLNTWVHVACVRSSGTLTFYINGSGAGSGAAAGSISSTVAISIGAALSGGTYGNFTGYISNARITKGGALYTTAFTPSMTPLTTTVSSGTVSLLTCQSNRFVDNSVNAFSLTAGAGASVQAFSPFAPQYQYTPSVTGGSGYFDGNGDYLTGNGILVTTTTANTFSCEGWFYPTTFANLIWLVGDMDATGGTNNVAVDISTGGAVELYWWDGAGKRCTSTSVMRLNQWNYFAIVVNAGAISIYVNSTTAGQSGTTTLTNRSAASQNFSVGAFLNSTTPNGYIGSLRWSTSARTISSIPTAPYTSDANTRLLLNFTNAGIYDGTLKNNLETVGNAQVSTSVVKYGTGSMYFDGSGDGLILPASPFYNFLDGNFTVEAWVYIAGNSPLDGLSRRIANVFSVSTSSAFSFDFIIRGDGTTTGTGLEIYNGTNIVNVTGTISQSTWHHIAVTKSGTSVYFFLNGTQMGTTQTTSGNWGSATVAAQVGRAAVTSYTFDLNGYIDDLRITKFARYTSNFIPPSVALPRQ